MIAVIFHILHKELLQTVRDKRMLMILLVAPVLQVVLFGYAVNLDLAAQPTIIADMDRSEASRAAARSIANDDSFAVVGVVDTSEEAERAIARGEAALALLIPRGFARDVDRGRAELLLVLDGSDSNTALRAGQEATQILNVRALVRQRQVLDSAAGSLGVSSESLVPRLSIEARSWFNPQMRTAVFLVPGVLALVLMIVTMLLTSMGLTREKEIGTLEQIMVTPVRPFELMIGKTLPFALIGLLDVGVIASAAALVFAVPVRGALPALFGASALYLMTTLGLGLFISTVSSTQQQAMLNTFFIMLPALMLSGYIFPIENMPRPVQLLTLVNPLRYYIELNRCIMVKGAALAELWQSATALAALGVFVLGGAILRFRKRVS
jgi:ABC-2 type transport system permease protein